MCPTISRAFTVLALSVLAIASPSYGADTAPPREYTLDLTTSVTAPAFALPAGMPSIPGMADMSRPSRTIAGEAAYRSAPSPPIFVSVPTSLGLHDNRLVLTLSRPDTTPIVVPRGRGEAMTTPEMDMSTKLYWHPTTASGPIVTNIHVPAMNISSGAAWEGMSTRARNTVDRTATGSEDVERMGAIGKGDYILNTGELTMPLEGFLLPVTVTTPASLMTIDPAAAIEVVWSPDTAARGYILHGRGMVMDGQRMKEMVLWVSTESVPPERVRQSYEPPHEGGSAAISEDVQNRVLLPPGTTRCVVPPGIFKSVDFFTLTVTAVGDDYLARIDGATMKGRIRSIWTATRMKGMDAMMGGGYPTGEGAENTDPGSRSGEDY